MVLITDRPSTSSRNVSLTEYFTFIRAIFPMFSIVRPSACAAFGDASFLQTPEQGFLQHFC